MLLRVLKNSARNEEETKEKYKGSPHCRPKTRVVSVVLVLQCLA